MRRETLQRQMMKGFTLIELLLVLVILASLAAIVVPKFTARSKQAKVTAAKTDISFIGGALGVFELDTGRYPTTEEGLNALMVAPTDVTGWNGAYLERGIPNDPWGHPYNYSCPGQHNTAGFDLYSFGPDGQDGTEDDIDNWTIQ